MNPLLLFAVVLAVLVGTTLYAVAAEMRHSSTRRSRWEMRVARERLVGRPGARPWRTAGTP